MLMVNDRRLNSDTFWFTLFHEIGHIMNEDFGISKARILISRGKRREAN